MNNTLRYQIARGLALITGTEDPRVEAELKRLHPTNSPPSKPRTGIPSGATTAGPAPQLADGQIVAQRK